MAVKVELFLQLCVNGRPLWMKTRPTKAENTVLMTDKEYDRILVAADKELSIQSNIFHEKEADLSKK